MENILQYFLANIWLFNFLPYLCIRKPAECSAVGSVLRSGRRGRAFESPHSDIRALIINDLTYFCSVIVPSKLTCIKKRYLHSWKYLFLFYLCIVACKSACSFWIQKRYAQPCSCLFSLYLINLSCTYVIDKAPLGCIELHSLNKSWIDAAQVRLMVIAR